MVTVNGNLLAIDGMTIADYLAQSSFDSARIAIECNEAWIPKAHYNHTVLQDGDRLEIVSFVGGG